MGFAEVMRDYYDSMPVSERNRVVDRLLRSVDRLRRSVINMLELSQLEAGRFAIQADFFDISALLNDLVEEFKPRSIPCKLEVQANGGIGPIFADRDKIEIVLFNLIDNAIKFSRPGSHISVSCRREADQVILEVSDEGRGISADFVEAVFEPFERGEEAQRLTAQGMGLGLYIVKKLVEAHGGEVQLRTTPGEGSTFAIIIPQAGSAGVHSRTNARPSRPSEPSLEQTGVIASPPSTSGRSPGRVPWFYRRSHAATPGVPGPPASPRYERNRGRTACRSWAGTVPSGIRRAARTATNRE